MTDVDQAKKYLEQIKQRVVGFEATRTENLENKLKTIIERMLQGKYG